MKVMQIIPNLCLAGAEVMCTNLAISLKRIGVDVIVVSLFKEETYLTERLRDEKINVLYLNKHLGMDFSIFRKLNLIIRKEHPDVIHTHLYVLPYVFPVALINKIKVFHTVHSVANKEQRFIGRKFAHILFNYFHVIPVALSKKIQETICEEYNLCENRVPIIFNGEDLSLYICKKNYSIKEKIYILHVGRFVETKNQMMIIDALMEFFYEYPCAEIHFLGNCNTELGKECKERVNASDLRDRFYFEGVKGDVSTFFAKADVFILPSLYEGIPMTIIEAMASGLPIIASNRGGIGDMITDGVDGILIEPDKTHFLDALKKLTVNEKLRKFLGLNARKKSMEFDSSSMAREYLKLYSECLNDK